MHAPDGFLTAGTAITTGVVSTGTVGVALSRARETARDDLLPLAGITAAFVFAAQMFNFPVAAGTTGHLLGGALAAILLGPWLGMLVVTVVVAVQALAFADGGLTALGYNVLNMAIVTALGGYAVFWLLRRLLPSTRAGMVGAAGLAGGASVVLSSMAFSLQWLFGASAPIPFDTVFGAMVGVHTLIGIGEGVITGGAIGAVLAVRPDLVHGAADLDAVQLSTTDRVGWKPFATGAGLVTLVTATVVSQFAGADPDGLERVASDQGFIDRAREHALDSSWFADYATAGIDNEAVSLAVAGVCGVLLTLLVAAGLALALRTGHTGGPGSAGSGDDVPDLVGPDGSRV